ncbi:hypothetical protein T11_9492 [Trichinella zimbabwensis]|uniref:Uncharacterized protein n=1 Tax=Trichinella zimbabwensis TaxID=268475 RepID=A0A0V1GUI8_9BILA|nr:hypothetical protein T11_9492 [Trichinella zimbabwensis]
MCFLSSALNVKVKKFNQARVNGGSNYDSLLACGGLVSFALSNDNKRSPSHLAQETLSTATGSNGHARFDLRRQNQAEVSYPGPFTCPICSH